jgi:hypothetical protein
MTISPICREIARIKFLTEPTPKTPDQAAISPEITAIWSLRSQKAARPWDNLNISTPVDFFGVAEGPGALQTNSRDPSAFARAARARRQIMEHLGLALMPLGHQAAGLPHRSNTGPCFPVASHSRLISLATHHF